MPGCASQGADDDYEDEPMEDGEQQPTTKKDLYRYFSGKGLNKMVLSFVNDRGLQMSAMVIVRLSQPVEDAYCKDLKQMEGHG